jgi:uncharacterized protein YfiM (DUF2279 family)
MRIITLLLLLCTSLALSAQPHRAERDSINYAKRQKVVLTGATVTYSAAIAGLHQLWYSQNPRSSFHLFNDNPDWQQMDKLGHFYSCFEMGRAGVEVMQWSGLPDRKAKWLGSMAGLLLMTPVEVMDGFSDGYGASWGDVLANKAGAGLLLSQLLIWDELRIQPKFSFHRSGLAPLRPNTLGSNLPQELLKDYNGQTYWLSVNPASFLTNHDFKYLPRWLNLSLGYGAENMYYSDAEHSRSVGYNTFRQYYLALDIDFTRIKTKSRFLKTAFFLINGLHVPGPALSFDRSHGLSFKPFYY